MLRSSTEEYDALPASARGPSAKGSGSLEAILVDKVEGFLGKCVGEGRRPAIRVTASNFTCLCGREVNWWGGSTRNTDLAPFRQHVKTCIGFANRLAKSQGVKVAEMIKKINEVDQAERRGATTKVVKVRRAATSSSSNSSSAQSSSSGSSSSTSSSTTSSTCSSTTSSEERQEARRAFLAAYGGVSATTTTVSSQP